MICLLRWCAARGAGGLTGLAAACAETLVMEEDAQPLEKPIIAPVTEKKHEIVEKELPETAYSAEFLTGLMSNAGESPAPPSL